MDSGWSHRAGFSVFIPGSCPGRIPLLCAERMEISSPFWHVKILDEKKKYRRICSSDDALDSECYKSFKRMGSVREAESFKAYEPKKILKVYFAAIRLFNIYDAGKQSVLLHKWGRRFQFEAIKLCMYA